MTRAKAQIEQILNRAGITINGPNDFDVKVLDERAYSRVLQGGSLALGESYMDGWWETKSLDQFIYKLLSIRLNDQFKFTFNMLWAYLDAIVTNQQTRLRSKKVAEEHYDLSPELYESFLDPYNQYTCGYFKDTENLNEAQEKKLDLICKKLQLSSRDKVLDIGCGWGGFAKYAAEHYVCHVTGITISKEQAEYARRYTSGLPVEIKIQDYRDLTLQYDKILICGMIEHVGFKNYRTIMEIVQRCLRDDGLFLLHTIGSNIPLLTIDPWLEKYIFPNTLLPGLSQIASAIEGLFVMEDWHNFGAYYDKTLMAWFDNFHKNWSKIKPQYSERFYRMWKYYLLSCAGNFRTRNIELWQVVLSRRGVPGGYTTVR